MSSRWAPKWELLNVTVNGRDEVVCFDKETKLYACPRCGPECMKGGIPSSSSYFFNREDLISHLNAHRYALWSKKKSREVTEEVEEEGEEEEDEE
ncbi:hypothetical protein [Metallosphaera hakonensis]|uniref:Uncharacterized protein n=1 Tax=Metallosphaera hakonensis JCM 8857 = DSM 7519 TaxID=1293036 RepID=A0A2U9ITI8_9CREN|nr:hypothetical protein [Metallosphaera hakonensis]AWR99338.1 hypothetical protein DFR87_06020 [Metallosphaera hakonensis JCM 8857 = DSM 7519]